MKSNYDTDHAYEQYVTLITDINNQQQLIKSLTDVIKF